MYILSAQHACRQIYFIRRCFSPAEYATLLFDDQPKCTTDHFNNTSLIKELSAFDYGVLLLIHSLPSQKLGRPASIKKKSLVHFSKAKSYLQTKHINHEVHHLFPLLLGPGRHHGHRNPRPCLLQHPGQMPRHPQLLGRQDLKGHPSRRVQPQHPHFHHPDLCRLHDRPRVRQLPRCPLRYLRGLHLHCPHLIRDDRL